MSAKTNRASARPLSSLHQGTRLAPRNRRARHLEPIKEKRKMAACTKTTHAAVDPET